MGLGHPPTPATPPDGVSHDPPDTSKFDDPQLDAPQFESPQFDAPGFDSRRIAAARTRRGGTDDSQVMRSSAVVAVGTALSRLTGFVRIAAIAYTLGVVDARRHVQLRQRGAEHRLRAAARRRAHRDARPAVRASTSSRTTTTQPSAIFTVAIARARRRSPSSASSPRRGSSSCTRSTSTARTSPSSSELATDLLRLFMPQMLFYGIVTLATAMLNARRRFLAAAFAPVLNNIVVIAVFLALPRIADGSLTVHSVLDDDGLRAPHRPRHHRRHRGDGAGAAAAAHRRAHPPALLPDWRHPAVLTMLRLSGWTVGYVIANQIALLVVTVLANGTDGGPFIYISAYAFFQLPHGLFAVSLMTTFTPEMATAAARDDLRVAAHAAVARTPTRGDRRRARGRAVPRPRARRSSSRCSTGCVLRGRRVAGRRHAGRVLGRAAAVLHLPLRDARVLRRATTRSRRSGSTASRTR